MKTLIAIIAVIFCFTICVNAQDYHENKISSGKYIYNCKSPGEGKWISLKNSKNKLFQKKMIIPNKEDFLSVIDINDLTRKKIETIFKETISAEDKEKMKVSKDLILVTFFISDSGRILELNFDLHKNTALKPQYLSRIEQKIKDEIVFSFLSDQLKGSNFISFSMVFSSIRMF